MADFTPASSLPPPDTGNLRSRPAAAPAGQGLGWWGEGWRLFAASPWIWIAITVIAFVIMLMVGFIPILGTVASSLLGPVFVGGILLGCRALDHGGELRIDHLFACFAERLMPLIVVGLLYLAGTVVILIVVAICMAFAIGAGGLGALLSGDPLHAGLAMLTSFGIGAMIALLIGLLLGVPLAMAIWFAPARVVFSDDDPMAAMKTSFSACLVNWLPMFVYGLFGLLFALVASIPFMLGWLVLAPVFAASVYASYKDIFGDPA